MKRLLLVPIMLTFLLATMHPAMAQSASDNHDKAFKVALIAYNASVIADTSSTLYLLEKGGYREANPVLAPFSDRPAAHAALRAGLAVGTTYSLIKLREAKPRLAFWITVASIAANSFATFHNMSLAR